MSTNFRKKQDYPSPITVMRELYNDYSLNTIRSLRDNNSINKNNQNIGRDHNKSIKQNNKIGYADSFQFTSQNKNNDCCDSSRVSNGTKYSNNFKALFNKSKRNQTIDFNRKQIDMEATLLSKRFNFKKLNQNNNIFNTFIKPNQNKDQNQDYTKRKGVDHTQKFTHFLKTVNKDSSNSLSFRTFDQKEGQQIQSQSCKNMKIQLGLTERGTNKNYYRTQQLSVNLIKRRKNKKISHFFKNLSRPQLQSIQNVNRGYFSNQYTKNHPLLYPHKAVIEKLQIIQKCQKQNKQNFNIHSNVGNRLELINFSNSNSTLIAPRLNLKEMKDIKIKLKQFSEIKREKNKILRENYILRNNHGKNLNIGNFLKQKGSKMNSQISEDFLSKQKHICNKNLIQTKTKRFLETKQNIFPYSTEPSQKINKI